MASHGGSAPGPEGYGKCKKCSCKVYSPRNFTGVCQNTRDDGNVCAHQNDDHELS